MKKDYGYRFLGAFFMLGVLALSVSFIFYWPNATYGNAAYLVLKIISLLPLLALIIMSICKAGFSKIFPLFGICMLMQGFPALLRIGYAKNGTVPVALTVIVSIVLFLLISFYLLMLISNNQFKDSENQAKHSSNYKG